MKVRMKMKIKLKKKKVELTRSHKLIFHQTTQPKIFKQENEQEDKKMNFLNHESTFQTEP